MKKFTLARKNRALDPPEPWETPYTRASGGFFYEYRYAGHPFAPRSPEDVPAGALGPLSDACGLKSLAGLFVIPASVRFIGHRGRKVVTPMQVLGIGPRAVALWAGPPRSGIAAAISRDELSSIEDVEILLYGRLSFLSPRNRLTIRYNTVARRQLEPALLGLRGAVADRRYDIPEAGEKSPKLPYKWMNILASPFLSAGECPERLYRYAAAPARNRRLPAKAQLLLLTAAELIFVRDSEDQMSFYGVDRFFFPRSRIDCCAVEGDELRLGCRGADIRLRLEPSLRSAALQWLGKAAPEAK